MRRGPMTDTFIGIIEKRNLQRSMNIAFWEVEVNSRESSNYKQTKMVNSVNFMSANDCRIWEKSTCFSKLTYWRGCEGSGTNMGQNKLKMIKE